MSGENIQRKKEKNIIETHNKKEKHEEKHSTLNRKNSSLNIYRGI